jgi:uncharacterized protein (TIGR03435 family)
VKKAAAALVLTGLAALAADPAFEAVSIKPNVTASDRVDFGPPAGARFTATNVSLRMLIMRAYKVKNFEVSGGPGWMNSDRYDVATSTAEGNISEAQFKLMLQSLLADRFQVRVHRETKQMPVYVLLPAKNGTRLPQAAEACIEHDAPQPSTPMIPCGGFFMDAGRLEGRRVSMATFVTALSNFLGRPVLDKTGYIGAFDLNLEFTFEGIAGFNGGGFGAPSLLADAGNVDSSKPTIFTAIQQQLGLRLESQKGLAEILVIDHAEKPSEN